MVFSMGMPAFAEESFVNGITNNTVPIEENISNETQQMDLELVIPYQTYEEFIDSLKIVEVVDSLPEGTSYCTSFREFYDKLYGSSNATSSFSTNSTANKKLGDLNAVFYATISGSKFISLNNISSSISPLYLGANWTQESYTHRFTDQNHVVSGDIYGHIDEHILTPVGFIRVDTESYRVPFELSTNEFN